MERCIMYEAHRMQQLAGLIDETSIGKASSTITVVMDLDKTIHAGERQTRHGDENVISDEEIKKTTERGIAKIANLLLVDKISVGDDIVIQSGGGLNIVGHLQSIGDQLQLRIITVMRKKNFKAKSGTIPIKV